MTEKEKLLTVKEVADFLRLSASSIYEMVRNDQIPHLRVGKRTVRFEKKRVEEWLEQRR